MLCSKQIILPNKIKTLHSSRLTKSYHMREENSKVSTNERILNSFLFLVSCYHL